MTDHNIKWMKYVDTRCVYFKHPISELYLKSIFPDWSSPSLHWATLSVGLRGPSKICSQRYSPEEYIPQHFTCFTIKANKYNVTGVYRQPNAVKTWDI